MAFPETLETLIEEGVIDAVRSRLMSGKEASVFVVERQGELLAAKVYKAREQRTFKATASYTEGRNQTRNSRDKRAMGKRTSYGRELIEESWRDVEVRALSGATGLPLSAYKVTAYEVQADGSSKWTAAGSTESSTLRRRSRLLTRPFSRAISTARCRHPSSQPAHCV